MLRHPLPGHWGTDDEGHLGGAEERPWTWAVEGMRVAGAGGWRAQGGSAVGKVGVRREAMSGPVWQRGGGWRLMGPKIKGRLFPFSRMRASERKASVAGQSSSLGAGEDQRRWLQSQAGTATSGGGVAPVSG